MELTRRAAGLCVSCKKAALDKWENVTRWVIRDFGFKNCPIFYSNTLSTDETTVYLSPLQCFTKGPNTKTILTPCNKPTKLYDDPDLPEIKDYLPASNYVSFEWRTKKCQNISNRHSEYKMEENTKIIESRKISTQSTNSRIKQMQDIRELQNEQMWLERMDKILKENYAIEEQRKNELLEIAETINIILSEKQKLEEIFLKVSRVLSKAPLVKIRDLENTEWTLLRYKHDAYSPIVVLENEEKIVKTYANQRLSKALEIIKRTFEHRINKNITLIRWYVPMFVTGSNAKYIKLYIENKKQFYNKHSQKICWVPIRLLHPNPKYIEQIREIGAEEIERTKDIFIQNTKKPQAHEAKSSKDIPGGNYLLTRYSVGTFHGKRRIYFFVLPTNDKGEPTTTEEIIVYGYFIDKEIEDIGGIETIATLFNPVFCRFGQCATTPTKKKHRKCKIRYNKI